jgi:uracil-DNA glycosylase family 4
MNESQAHAWEALGLGPRWKSRAPAPGGEGAPPQQAQASGEAQAPTAVPLLGWEELRARVADCRACGLSATRTRTVFGVGPENAPWLLIGEAPGAEEDARGEPFVGQAGRLLDNMLAALGLSRERDVFIANVLKCRPPGNRDPLPEEVACCEPYLARQVELLSPRVIVVMGRFAAQSLLRTQSSIANLRGRRHAYESGGRSIPVVVTYHPAYLLRNLGDKAKAWADLCLAQATFEEALAAP